MSNKLMIITAFITSKSNIVRWVSRKKEGERERRKKRGAFRKGRRDQSYRKGLIGNIGPKATSRRFASAATYSGPRILPRI